MRSLTLTLLMGAVTFCQAADFSGEWIAETAAAGDPQYSRVSLKADGMKLTGMWNETAIEGMITGDAVELTANQEGRVVGSLKGKLQGAEIVGQGAMPAARAEGGGRGGRGGGGGGAGARGNMASAGQPLAWKLVRITQRAGGPKTWDYEPKVFYGTYSAAFPPVLRILPGDTIRSRTIDTSGRDNNATRTPGGNPETGPFYVEGALPGDTLVVKLNKVRVNRDTARGGNRINGRAVTPAYVEAAEYSAAFDSSWKLDREKGYAMLANPTERMRNYKVPILPMIGCIGTAPAQGQAFRGTDLGVFGGNMDYNQLGEGATVYLPVFNAGGLLFFGDGHAAMGDGELNGSALETSLDVEMTVDLVKGYSTGNPRLEDKNYVMSVGVAGSVADAIQIATSQLATWMKKDYKLNDNEVAVLLGTALKYDICELVDPHFSVSAKLPKSALAGLQ